MNILHHKSYHVYNKKNIEKVKKDEEKEREKEKVIQERKQLAESEFRLALLRKKANDRLPIENTTKQVEHVNLFQNLVEKNTNEEHEAERKEKSDKWDKQITMYLNNKEDVPWYTKQQDDKYIDKYKFKHKKSEDHKRKRKRPIELQQDPLHIIQSHMKKREKKQRKHTKETTKKSSSSSSIEDLRTKRLERERNEKQRVKELYLGPTDGEPDLINERNLAYNSQFNRKETLQAKSYYK